VVRFLFPKAMVEGADFLETNSSSSSPWPTDMDMEFVVVECVIFGGGGGGEKGGFPFPRWGKDDDMFLLLLLSTKVDFVTRFAQDTSRNKKVVSLISLFATRIKTNLSTCICL